MLRRWLKLSLWALIFTLLLLSLGRSLWLTRQARLDIQEQTTEVEALQQEVNSLDAAVQEATSSYELERRVREDLHLQRPDEVIIELPPAL